MSDICFGINVATDEDTGNILSAYFQFRRGKVHKTLEFANGSAFADYNSNGELLGVELIGPCRITIIDQVAVNESASLRQKAKRFMKKAGPPMLIVA